MSTEARPASADPRVQRVETVISLVLRSGVIASLIVVFAGLAITLAQHRTWLSDTSVVPVLIAPGRPEVPSHWSDVASGLARGDGQAVVMLGLLLLISTPVIRVAISALLFAYQRDRIFVLITVLVFVLLSLSFLVGKAEA